MPPADVREWPVSAGGRSRRPSFVRLGQIVVDDGDVAEARAHFGPVQTDPSPLGVTRIHLPSGRQDLTVELPSFQARLRAKATWKGRLPSPVCYLAPWISPGGGSGPVPVDTPPEPRVGGAANAPTVVFDSGLLKNHSPLSPLDRAVADQQDLVTDGASTTAYRRHGSFVASRLLGAKNLPSAQVRDVFGAQDGVDDWELALGVHAYLVGHPTVRVVNLSCGAFAPADSPPLALRALVESHPTVLWVAAAGNLDLSGVTDQPRPAYPAFFPAVVGVGATDSAGGRAPFTDLLSTDVWAPGVDVVGVFGSGNLTGTNLTFSRYARWSGTSFAAPIVAAELTEFVATAGNASGEVLAHNAIAWLKARYPGGDTVVI
jgi:hypothetical protein